MTREHPYPFRLGTTSYIVPDEIIPNVLFLCDKVDDIELVLFESDEFSNLPSADDIATLREIAALNSLTYSVHLPLDVYLGNEDPEERRRSVEKCLRVIELTRSLQPSAYVTHFESGPGVDINGFTQERKRGFQDALANSLSMLLGECTVESGLFCVETLNYPMEIISPIIDAFGLSVTLDVGHLVYYGFPVADYLQRYLAKTGVLHMHGVKEGKDHNSMQYMPPAVLEMVLDELQRDCRPGRVLTMEIFSEEDFHSSLQAIRQCWNR